MPLFLEAKDDAGRKMATPPPQPITRTVFTSRPKDRASEVATPWSPEELARALRQAEEGDLSAQADMFEHMIEKDGELAGLMQTRTLAPSRMRWSVVPRNDTPEAKKVADKVKEVVEAIPNMRGVLLKMCDGIGKGISALEIDWRGDKTISGIRWIHAKRYRFDYSAETFMIVPDDPAKENEPIPIVKEEYKFIVHKPQLRATHASRGGVLRTIVWAFLFRNYSVKDWVTFSEIYGMPLRVAKYPPGSKEADKDELRAAMELLASDAYAIIDSRVTMEYVDAVNRGQHPGEAIYNAMGRQYQLAILGQDQTSTHNDAGGRTQVEFGGAPIQQMLVEADCEDIQLTLETDLLYPITYWHFDAGVAQRLTPKFKMYYEPPEDYVGFAGVDETVHLKLGLPTTWGDIAKRYGRELPEGMDPETIVFFNEYVPPGFESKPHVIITSDGTGASTQQREKWDAEAKAQFEAEPVEGEVVDGPPVARGKAPLRALPGGKAEQGMYAAFALLAQAQNPRVDVLNPEQAELDAKLDALVPRAAAAMRQLAAPVLAIIASAQSMEEVTQRLSEVYPELDESKIEKLMMQAWYTTRLYGAAVAEFRTVGGIDADQT